MSSSEILLNIPLRKIEQVKPDINDQDIAKSFINFLQLEIANTQDLITESNKIRHQVYCSELNFLPCSADGLEKDEFDEHSIFALIRHKPSNEYTGCVRVVTSPSPEKILPIENFCKDSIQHKKLAPDLFNREDICEISRLAVKAQFCRRKNEKCKSLAISDTSENNYSEIELRCFPFIAIGLYMAGASIALKAGFKHAFVMMEPKLARSMKFVGIKFVQIGKPVDYHGIRAPYYINAEIFFSNLNNGLKNLYIEIEKEIKQQFDREVSCSIT